MRCRATKRIPLIIHLLRVHSGKGGHTRGGSPHRPWCGGAKFKWLCERRLEFYKRIRPKLVVNKNKNNFRNQLNNSVTKTLVSTRITDADVMNLTLQPTTTTVTATRKQWAARATPAYSGQQTVRRRNHSPCTAFLHTKLYTLTTER
ncbi:unnamed protein product [Colias eurytheme]|nr:unnamed protein product [Colias eurytheme]